MKVRALAAVWLLLFAISLALYTPFLAAPYFLDDLLFFHAAPPPHLYDFFFLRGAAAHLYRPAEAMIMTAVQTRFGLNALPLHLVSLTAHASLCLIVWVAALRLGFSKFQAALACALMLFTQMGAPALLGNDTMSQAMSAALGNLACVLLGIAYLLETQPAGYLAASALAYFGSLFFKETALGFSLVIAFFTFLAALRASGWPKRLRFAAARLAPYFLLTIVYFALRIHAGMPLSGSGEYRVSVGFNVLTNLAQFAAAATSPVSSVTVAMALQESRFDVVAAAAAADLFVILVLLAGIIKSQRKQLAAVLLCWALAALFPAMLLQHVSELYVYNAAPAIALLFALALGALYDGGRAAQAAAVLCAGLLIVGEALATRQKAYLMNANGQAAASMMSSIASYMKNLPPQSEILLTQEEPLLPKYSIYVLRGVGVLDIGNEMIGPIYGRPDVTVKLIESAAIPALLPDNRRLILELRDGVLRPATIK